MQPVKINQTILAVFLVFTQLNVRSQDLGIPEITYPANNQTVHLQYTYQVIFILKNYGPNTIPQGTLINFDLLFDKALFQSYNLTTSAAFGSGDSLSITIPPLTISNGNSTIELCVVVRQVNDMNPLNDTSCSILPFKIDNNVDLEPKLVDIVLPERDSILVVSESIYKMEGYILNSGTVTLPKDYEINVEYTMYGIKKSIKTKTLGPVAPNENIVVNMLAIPPIQSTPGNFNVCLKVLNADDMNATNDEHCQTFYVKDYTGINNQIARGDISSELRIKDLIIRFGHPQEAVAVHIFDQQGRRVYQRYFDNIDAGEILINMTTMGSGLYIVQVMSNSSVLHRNKLMLR
jgi:hypothetical protein